MRIRPAVAEDAPALAGAHATAFDASWTAPDIAALMRATGGFALLAEDAAGHAHGFILGRALAGEAEILTLAVAPAARRSGLGGALVEALAEEAKARGARTLFLEVAADNTGAIALYQGAGFERAGLRRAYYSRPGAHRMDALILRRALNSPPPRD